MVWEVEQERRLGGQAKLLCSMDFLVDMKRQSILSRQVGKETLMLLFGCGEQTIEKDLQPMVTKSIKPY